MLPASNKGLGMNIGFPDVCPTVVGPAVVPIPYPNLAMNAMAAPFSLNVFLTMMPALNMGSLIPLTNGDNAGVPGTTMMMGGYTMGTPTVIVNGLPAVTLTCPTFGNMHNDSLGAVLVPSLTHVLFAYAREGADPALDVDALDDLALSMAPVAPRRRIVGGVVGYLGFDVIASDAAPRFHAALRELEARGVTSVVIDLRGCRGGDFDAALDIAAELLPNGSELATVVDRDGDETTHYAYRAYPWKMRFTVAIDRSTASSAEVLAGILQSYGRARVVGDRTYGKGICQRIARSPASGAPFTDTVGECFLPGRRRIQGVGILPDAD